jgi:hypothetical protein
LDRTIGAIAAVTGWVGTVFGAGPVAPVDPVDPVAPLGPVDPVTPVAPVGPVEAGAVVPPETGVWGGGAEAKALEQAIPNAQHNALPTVQTRPSRTATSL